MSRYYSYLNSAKEILREYNGKEPFASFLKKFFARYKKFGSRDRKQVGQLCYSFFRLGKSLPDLSIDEKLLIGSYLSTSDSNEIVQNFKPEWKPGTIEEKTAWLNAEGVSLSITDIFPWETDVSGGLDPEKFNRSFLIQPELFLRLRPGHDAEQIPGMRVVNEHCIALPIGTKLEEYIAIDKEAVIQDYSSQRVSEFLQQVKMPSQGKVWDCCAASGGKSILAIDTLGKIELTVSDIRESILVNLNKRFERAEILKYRSFVDDITRPSFKSDDRYQLIICDAPCTGSGTWSRTPEQLFYFDNSSIEHYSLLQKKIVSNTIPCTAKGGYFLYITCSVFKKENEEIIDFIKENFQLELVKSDLLKGYDRRADTLFAALFSASG